jgi:hypothetical protein
MFNRHHGPTGDATVLVAHGASKVFNPTLPQSVIDRALEKDRARAMAEYLAEFRTDVEGFVALEVARLVSATIASSNLLPVSHMKDSAIPQAEAKIVSRSQSLIATTATTQSSSTPYARCVRRSRPNKLSVASPRCSRTMASPK